VARRIGSVNKYALLILSSKSKLDNRLYYLLLEYKSKCSLSNKLGREESSN
jgi:hypothetical protein